VTQKSPYIQTELSHLQFSRFLIFLFGQPCNSIIMFHLRPAAAHLNNETLLTCKEPICIHSLWMKDPGKWYLSSCMRHSGTRAPFLIFIVISLGWMCRFSFPIYNVCNEEPKKDGTHLKQKEKHVYLHDIKYAPFPAVHMPWTNQAILLWNLWPEKTI
jgi:hypothetical protein